MSDWKKDSCEYLRQFLQFYVVDNMQEFEGFFEVGKINSSSVEKLKKYLGENIVTLRKALKDILETNEGQVYVALDGSRYQANFVRKVEMSRAPDGIFKVGDVLVDKEDNTRYELIAFYTTSGGNQRGILKGDKDNKEIIYTIQMSDLEENKSFEIIRP